VISADLVIAGAGGIATVLAAALALTGRTHPGRHRSRHH